MSETPKGPELPDLMTCIDHFPDLGPDVNGHSPRAWRLIVSDGRETVQRWFATEGECERWAASFSANREREHSEAQGDYRGSRIWD